MRNKERLEEEVKIVISLYIRVYSFRRRK